MLLLQNGYCWKHYLRRPITKPLNFLKSSSELNFVFKSITRSKVFLWAGPACITASITRHTLVFIRPNDVITSSYKAIDEFIKSFIISCSKSNLKEASLGYYLIGKMISPKLENDERKPLDKTTISFLFLFPSRRQNMSP